MFRTKSALKVVRGGVLVCDAASCRTGAIHRFYLVGGLQEVRDRFLSMFRLFLCLLGQLVKQASSETLVVQRGVAKIQEPSNYSKLFNPMTTAYTFRRTNYLELEWTYLQ